MLIQRNSSFHNAECDHVTMLRKSQVVSNESAFDTVLGICSCLAHLKKCNDFFLCLSAHTSRRSCYEVSQS